VTSAISAGVQRVPGRARSTSTASTAPEVLVAFEADVVATGVLRGAGGMLAGVDAAFPPKCVEGIFGALLQIVESAG
jgi:hypothetical protein